MERTELSEALRPWRSGNQPAANAGPVIIAEADRRKFMTAFAEAVAGEGEIFLHDPNWSAGERAQAEDLLKSKIENPKSKITQGWLMIPTGGTGGRIKFARHDGTTVAAAVRGFAAHFNLERVNAVGVLPLHHVSGLMAWMRCALTGGDFRPTDWKEIEAGGLPVLPDKSDGWVISLVPTQLERLLFKPEAVSWLRRFRAILLGGGPAWPELLTHAAEHRLPVSPGYGMTESAAMVAALRPEEYLAGARSCGLALPHANIAIGAGDEIVIWGESLFLGYYPEWREGGAFVTQDHGRLDAAGHLHVAGRRDTVIISGGEKVEPAEIEAALRGTGQFPDVVVLGLPDAKWGQLVVAVYPGNAQPSFHPVIQAMSRLAVYKRPKRYIPLVDPWPANAQGKVDRVTLVGRVVAQQKQRR